MEHKKDDLYYVEKIIGDLAFIQQHTAGITLERLEQNEVLVDSVMFRLIQVSENSDKLSERFKENRKNIPWRAIKGLRNRIVHEYGNVDLSVVFDAITNDIPDLLSILKLLIGAE